MSEAPPAGPAPPPVGPAPRATVTLVLWPVTDPIDWDDPESVQAALVTLRYAINDPYQPDADPIDAGCQFTDAQLLAVLQTTGTVAGAAAVLWTQKAILLAEGRPLDEYQIGSERLRFTSLDTLLAFYQAQADYWADLVGDNQGYILEVAAVDVLYGVDGFWGGPSGGGGRLEAEETDASRLVSEEARVYPAPPRGYFPWPLPGLYGRPRTPVLPRRGRATRRGRP